MENSLRVAAIIPFYNEGIRILRTLEILHQQPIFDQIICVDDGSTDAAREEIASKFKHVEIVRLEQNAGKCAAVKMGLEKVRTDFIFLLDADLKDLDVRELVDAIEEFKNKKLDMYMLCRAESPFAVRLVRGDIIFTGMRIMRTGDLRKIFEKNLSRYELEIAINKYMLDHRKNIGWARTKATNTYKVEKWGFWGGLKMELIMNYNLIRYAGLFQLLRQIIFFARD